MGGRPGSGPLALQGSPLSLDTQGTGTGIISAPWPLPILGLRPCSRPHSGRRDLGAKCTLPCHGAEPGDRFLRPHANPEAQAFPDFCQQTQPRRRRGRGARRGLGGQVRGRKGEKAPHLRAGLSSGRPAPRGRQRGLQSSDAEQPPWTAQGQGQVRRSTSGPGAEREGGGVWAALLNGTAQVSTGEMGFPV